MSARLTEIRVPGDCRHALEPTLVAELLADVTAALGEIRCTVVVRGSVLRLEVEVPSDAMSEAMQQAFAIVLATFRSATEGWRVARALALQLEGEGLGDRLDRLGLPLSLYGAPQAEGAVELIDGGVLVTLPEGPSARLGRLAAVLVALLRGEPVPLEAVPLHRDGERLRWRGLGARGRATRVGTEATVQRAALQLLEALEPSPALHLSPSDRVLLREELTGAIPLPVDEAEAPPIAAPPRGIQPARCDDPEVSIVLASHRERHRVMLTVEALRASTEGRYEVVVVDDGSDDGCCDFLREHPDLYPEVTLVTQDQQGSARARNSGVAHAQAPVVVFMDAHCFPRAGWLSLMRPLLDDPSVGIVTPAIGVAGDPSNRGYGFTIVGSRLRALWLPRQGDEPCRVPGAGAGCIVLRRGTFEAIGGFEPMRRYGLEDTELSIRCWLAGFDVVVEPRAEVGHWFKESPNFELPWTDYLYNVLRTAVLHFDGPQLRTIIEGCSADASFGAAMALLLSSDVWERRAQVRSRAVRTAAWYCERFAIDLTGT
ncbi:MAG: glycosyltransferase [Myxococcales bacterium]|nr:glycosyltransferase [Myxococcales bacterium]